VAAAQVVLQLERRGSISHNYVLRYCDVEIHPSAHKHGVGNLLEIVWLELADDVRLVIHVMPLRPTFHDLLPPPEEDTP